MIDFVKIESPVDEDRLLALDFLDWNGTYSVATGESKYPIRSRFHDLYLTITSRGLKLHGSLHKLYNAITGQGSQNHSMFSINQLDTTIGWLVDHLQISTSEALVTNLEYGVNCKVPMGPSDLIKSHVITWSGYNYSRRENFDYKGRYYQWERDQYFIKLYSKSEQYLLDSNLLRFEKKSIKSAYHSKLGIQHVEDLLQPEVHQILRSDLLKTWDKFIMIDPQWISCGEMTNSHRERLQRYSNPLIWEQYRAKGAGRFYYHNKKFRELNSRTGTNSMQLLLHDSIAANWDDLTDLQKSLPLDDFTIVYSVKSDNQEPSRSHIPKGTYPDEIYSLEFDHPDRKKLRNARSNLKQRLLTLAQKAQHSLFPLSEQVQLSQAQYEDLSNWIDTPHDVLKDLNLNQII